MTRHLAYYVREGCHGEWCIDQEQISPQGRFISRAATKADAERLVKELNAAAGKIGEPKAVAPCDGRLGSEWLTDQLQTIDDRTIRARKFASQVMVIIGDCVSDKDGASSRLIDAAYRADIEITKRK